MKQINEIYLKQIIEKARNVLGKEYNQVAELLKPFEAVNTYLIHQTNEKEWNVLIKIPHEHEREYFYAPTIFAIALLSLYKNYVYSEPEYEIGDIVEKGGVRYEITDKTESRYELHPKKGNLTVFILKENIKACIHIAGVLTERESKQFENYRKFFRSTFNIDREVISKFKYKSVIVTSKEIIESLKNDRKKNYKAFPFRYITKTGIKTNNLPIDPMIYIVNDYDTAQNYVFNQKENKIDTVIFIGSPKYRDEIAGVALNDRQMGRFQNCIFIGSEDISGFQSIRKWNWTQEEINYFNQTPQAAIEPIVVGFPELSEKVATFDRIIRSIEKDYTINLSQYRGYIRKIFRLVVSDRINSRLNNQLENLIFRFEHDKTLQDELFGIGVGPIDDDERLKIAFGEIINLIKKTHNPKYQKLRELSDYNFVVVPKHIREVWEDELKALYFRKIPQAILFDEFLRLDRESEALFLDYFDYEPK